MLGFSGANCANKFFLLKLDSLFHKVQMLVQAAQSFLGNFPGRLDCIFTRYL